MLKRLLDPEYVAFVVILGLSAIYLVQLPIGEMTRFDEFMTLDRSNGFLLTGDWMTVSASNIPNFQKPPLQYWMGAALLATGMDENLAMRLPSWLFSVVCLFATGALAREIAPRHPWAVPAAILLFASSIEFWPYAMSGMLETGSAAFVSLALLYAYRGLEQPRAWWGAAVFIGLGALQKSPAAFAAVIVFIAGAAIAGWIKGIPMPGLRSRHLAGAGLATLLLVGAWPILQLALHGYEAIQDSLQRELIDRFSPAEGIGHRGLGDVLGIVFRDEPFLRLGAIIGLFVLPGLMKEPRIWGFTVLTVAYIVLVVTAGGAIYPRYTLNFLPMFSAILAIWIFQAPWTMRRKWIVTGIISALMFGPISFASRDTNPAPEMLAAVGAQLRPEDVLLVCAWAPPVVAPGAVSYYASNGRPFVYLRDPAEIEAHAAEIEGRPIRGLCSETELAAIRSAFVDVTPVETLGEGYVHFVARR
jgi:4-amino-4-deoxy-L-arabinose transferase-like glycosyltransferase